MFLTVLEALGIPLVLHAFAGWWNSLMSRWRNRRAVAHAVHAVVEAFPAHAALLRKRECKAALKRERDAITRPGSGSDRHRLAQALMATASDRLDLVTADALAGHLLSELAQQLRSDPNVVGQEILRRAEKLQSLHDPAPAVTDAIALGRAAAHKDLDRYREASRAFRGPLVHLPLHQAKDKLGNDPPVSLEDIAERLTGLCVLEGGPGSGKTTTLLQLAEVIADRRRDAVTLLVSVPHWSESSTNDDLLAHCATKDAFIEQGTTTHHLRSLARGGHLVVLLDGWNEVPPASLNRLLPGLKRTRQDFPLLAILVGTRMAVGLAEPHAVFRVAPLTEHLRDDILARALLPDDPRREAIRHDPALDEITRTPLYLSAFLAAPVDVAPVRGELLSHLIAQQKRPANELRFRDALGPFRDRYLQDLAFAAVKTGRTWLPQTDARRVVSDTARVLADDGQMASAPQPEDVLLALAACHLLIRSSDAIEATYSFPHQEFRDWYASFVVEERLAIGPLAPLPSAVAELVDTPVYEGALLFAVERLSRGSERDAAAASDLVVGTLRIAPMLAVVMLRRSGSAVWPMARDQVVRFARRWHRPGTVDRAFHFMLTTGYEEFAEEVWSLVASPDPQVRARALPPSPPFPFTMGSFGRDFSSRALALPDDTLKHLLHALAGDGSATAQEVAVEVACATRNTKVRTAVGDALVFRGSRRLFAVLAQSFTDTDWEIWARGDWLHPTELPDELSAKLVQAKIRLGQTEPEGARRATALLSLAALGKANMRKVLEEMESPAFDPSIEAGFGVVESAARLDPVGVSGVLRRRLVRGLPVGPWAAPLIAGPALASERDSLLELLVTGKLRSDERRAAGRLLTDQQVSALLDRLLAAYASEGLRDQAWRDRVHAIEDAISAVPASAVARVLGGRASLSWEHGRLLVSSLTRVFAPDRSGRSRANSTPEPGPDEREAVLAVAERWTESLLQDAGRNETDGARLAELIGSLRLPHGTGLIVRLLHGDLERWRHVRTERCTPGEPIRAWGPALMNYRFALAAIGGETAAEAALALLDDHDFGVEAAEVLRICARKQQVKSVPSDWIDFAAAVATQHAANGTEEPHPYAAAILLRIDHIDLTCGDDHAVGTAIALAAAVAGLPCGSRTSDVLAVLTSPHGSRDGGRTRRRGLASLVMQGYTPPARVLAPLCKEAIATWRGERWGNPRDRFFVVDQWLSLLAFSDDPAAVLPLLAELGVQISPWMLRRTIEALGHNTRDAAGDTLVALGEIPPAVRAGDDGWLRAIARHWRELRAATRLLDTVTSSTSSFRTWFWRGESDPVMVAVTEAVRTHDILMEKLVSAARTGIGRAAEVLCAVAALARDDERLLAGVLSALPPGELSSLPFHFQEFAEALCTDRRPVPEYRDAYEIVPRAAPVLRRQLFAKACDSADGSRAAAALLLEHIDALRDEHGTPEFGEQRHPDLSSGVAWPLEADLV